MKKENTNLGILFMENLGMIMLDRAKKVAAIPMINLNKNILVEGVIKEKSFIIRRQNEENIM
jgi:hypothetical protein